MSLKTENSRRVAKSCPVCMGLKSSISNAFLYEKLVYKIVRQHRLNVGQLSTARATSYGVSIVYFLSLGYHMI
jgi:shikimate kinase